MSKEAPEEPNAYKFETLVLDMVKLQDSCLAFEVDRKREFASAKNKEGVDSLETTRDCWYLTGLRRDSDISNIFTNKKSSHRTATMLNQWDVCQVK